MTGLPEIPEGLTVKFEHLRWVTYGPALALVNRRVAPKAAVVLPQGGRTIARLYQGEDLVAVGVAICRENDNYDRDYGRRIAVARALANLEGRLHPGPRVKAVLQELVS